ncbi:beta-ketoacyl-[acyl-carrier-protein] synthase family protein [Vagococcus salmoninarum]|uniref:Ketosynthase family 3 (KS3) domain-containing protein n=1 Tax=Vagococcus salmoninarum TaxID=2739 RepID=A0A429ZJZ7_9ENTE|nr:beta-ketoacyl-[acyl-carrier-protein] synthase family protein [Vagococcus salmoninarum]MBE9389915.1 beta-ketoacyl-[acyl-carrier-protein] synthase family protein [Vagococcus salmoninarum]RST94011.1 hypothetical protein CBF35_11190 [Vagococcus salmoninarum]
MTKEVVVTGIGLVTSIGRNDLFWQNCLSGVLGTSQVTHSLFSYTDQFMGGQIKNYDINAYYSAPQLAEIGRGSQFLYDIISQSLTQSQANIDMVDTVYIGTTMGDASLGLSSNYYYRQEVIPHNFLEKNPREQMIKDTLTCLTDKKIPHYLIANACSAGNYALANAYQGIKYGEQKMVLAGGVDPFSSISLLGFKRLNAIAETVCRPFSKERDGMLVSEGAALLVLEEKSHAEQRGVPILAELVGVGLSSDAYHINIPHPQGLGLKAAITGALENAQLTATEIDYISLHGTGTKKNDVIEAKIINDLFPAQNIIASSIKSMLGHTMGASSAIEAAVCCYATKHDLLPPTTNFLTPDPACPIDCIPNKMRQKTVNYALNLSAGFGGTNAALIFKKYA